MELLAARIRRFFFCLLRPFQGWQMEDLSYFHRSDTGEVVAILEQLAAFNGKRRIVFWLR